ncbi:unnamed protein product [Owenia fusiformis]|uniref:Uncharacterized protein n=1 Tax=Owenia fusiformis TaxID=6347 RepID=A0A8J1TVG9_OWEFU|nr:unnamed protein product [Owenia fusiformis]
MSSFSHNKSTESNYAFDRHITIVQLTEFVEFTAHKVDIQNVYTPSQLKEQTTFVENLVKDICVNVGKTEPTLATDGVLNRGSYYDGTKIVNADEYDYEPLLTLSKAVTEVSEFSVFPNQGFRTVRIDTKMLPKPLPAQCLKDINENGVAELSSKELLKFLHCTILEALKYMNTVELKKSVRKHMDQGVVDHYMPHPHDTPYLKGEVSVHSALHGPSVWLRVGAPLGTTDIDLCFCLRSKACDKHVMVSARYRSYESHWLESIIDLPEVQKYKLTLPHNKLLLTLKYMTHLACTVHGGSHVSSHILRTVLLHHQRNCQETDLGECLLSIIKNFMIKPGEKFDYDANMVHLIVNAIEIHDIVHHETTLRTNSMKRVPMLIVLLWIVQQTRHNEDSTWIQRIVDPQFPGNISDDDMLHSLVTSLDFWDNSYSKNPPTRIFQWHHGNTATHVSITGDW